ncbi:hypothetical protein [Komagataeibacter europaeus]|uniref:hypothetical protein n=1 Tax=Komagataeibacter europaeus TaxID=33995 RepID=UPI000B55ACFA|nr:hypothetical protein [Komagataeibacter europaeus]ARW18367.1 hypothetical protein S101446_03293 [Komagataeibacter europaeus]
MATASSASSDTKNGNAALALSNGAALSVITSSMESLSSAASNLVATLGKVGDALDDNKKKATDATKQISDAFATTASGGLSDFLKGVASGKSALQSLKAAAIDFGISFTSQLSEIAMKSMFGSAETAGGSGGLLSGLKSFGSGLGSFFTDLFHEGGVVGGSGMVRSGISPAAFAGAMRYHTGGIAGLAPNEVPAILQRDEEVLTRSDPRHILNGGTGTSAAGSTQSIRNVLVMNPKDLAQAVSGAHGEKVVLTHIKNNAASVRSILGVNRS